ncbi:hypothetical protein GGQ22_18855 [Nocardioides sp. zg-579]|uniref:Peptidase n=1 Tax=Nocardioides marmotae TaxID=2663857 RepID=A0A6I3JGQ3_9ACTN|nr:hypothetical protein [Nocardioides marmotae]MCR6033475.1 hypothetical protein [Gordonia jinghuaiqii]MTB97133.1 hypothetical protein [Nocardioides marmotae]QKE00785.1 hypothetical protein HPC71_06625 [Nocardioides marmotae]
MRNAARLLAGGMAATVLSAGLVAAPAGAATTTTPKNAGKNAAKTAPKNAAARWLTGQLTDGLVHNDHYGVDDYGLTADVALALDGVGGRAAQAKAVRKALAPHVDSWTTGVDYGSDDVYAGSVAKAAVVAQRTGGDARRFGGVDLVERLEGRVLTSGAARGRIQDQGSADYANTLGQAFAAEALSVAGSKRAAAAVRFLLAQQCGAGYFRVTLDPADASTQTCAEARRAQAKPSVDATAAAVLSLREVPQQTAKVRRAIKAALAWLAKRAQRDGLYASEGQRTGGDPNANSTGLAAWALGDAGRCGAARTAARGVAKLQLSGSYGGTPLAGEKGAIPFDRAAKLAGRDGIAVAERDQWRRATAQSTPGLAYVAGCR